MTQVKNIYSARAEERRRQFNNIINKIDMVLMNNITEVDENIYYSFESDVTPMGNDDCDIQEAIEAGDTETDKKYVCHTHGIATDEEFECEDKEDDSEVYQWFAINPSDATYLKNHGQAIAYSEVLDTYFLAIMHFGTSWDYVDSMVEAFSDAYYGLEDFEDTTKELA